MTDLSGRTALVTGAAQGLGYAISTALYESGARVIMADNNPLIHSIASDIGERTAGTFLDVSSEEEWERCSDAVEAEHGPIDILVNNAAITVSTPIWDISSEEWDRVLAVNLRSVFLGCKLFGRLMKQRNYGRIINVSSMAGQKGGVVAGAHYSASKGGIISLTKCFALELSGHGVTVNSLSPAAIEGPMSRQMPAEKVRALANGIPVGRLGNDREVGAAVIYLAGNDAGFVTGSTLDVNGGLLMR